MSEEVVKAKHQIPTPSSREIPESKHQKPSSKHQRNPKFKAPNRGPRLELLWCLVFGVFIGGGSEVKTNPDHKRVAAGQVAFESVVFVAQIQFAGLPAHPQLAQPVRGFIADRTDGAGINDAPLDSGRVPV